uniref:Uncharacterized protein n=1 Tax=Caldisericum exile TaxID=693075 RepID=A0A7C4TV32_9BACT
MDKNFLSMMISQDIKAATRAFEIEDFEFMNILGNRIMSNALFGDDSKLALPGFFLKHVAIVYMWLKAYLPSSKFSEAKKVGKEYLVTLSDFSNEREDKLWENFHKFNNGIRKYTITDIEAEAYTENPKITHDIFKWLIKYLNDKKDVLLCPNNLFIKGILNEMERVSKVHGCELTDTYAISLLTALDRYFDYFQIAYGTLTGEVDKDKVRSMVFPYIGKITELFSSENVKPEDINSILWELIKGWREFFIQYMELPRRASEKLIELPEEYRKKLAEHIAKALEKEVKL